MKIAQWIEILELAVAKQGQWAVYVRNALGSDDEDEAISSYVLEEIHKHWQAPQSDPMVTFCVGGTLFFDNEAEARTYFKIFNMPPAYSSGVYAMLFRDDGVCVDENT